MERPRLRPYLPFMIAGGIVLGEGGAFFPLGLMFRFLSTMVPLGSTPFAAFALPMIIIGGASLVVGLTLLIVGISKRSKWLLENPQI